MKRKASYFIQNNFAGESEVDTSYVSKPSSIAYFCGSCGEIWSRIILGEDYWRVIQAPCEKHKPLGVIDWLHVPGSLLSIFVSKTYVSINNWACTIEYLPPELIVREFQLHLTHYEKEVQYDN